MQSYFYVIGNNWIKYVSKLLMFLNDEVKVIVVMV